jgi:hypothetical protein
MINKTNTDCETTLCYYDTAIRPRFFHGMLLTDEHLRAEQDYHREALKRVNRHLWGSGIVCGLTVEKKDLCIKINPGVAIDCCGNLIEVCKCITLDLSKECEKKYGSDCPPRQSQGTVKDFEIKKYLVLRYVERETDLEPVLTPDTDCEPAGGKSKCSASKVQEGFCIELWDKCPCPDPCRDVGKSTLATLMQSGVASASTPSPSNASPAAQQPAATEAQQQAERPIGGELPSPLPVEPVRDCMELSPPCSDCGCCESAVGLGYLNIRCAENAVDVTCECRHYVLSPRLLNWLLCLRAPKPDRGPTQIADPYSTLGHGPTASLVAAVVEFDTRAEQIKELKQQVEQLAARVSVIDAPKKATASKAKPPKEE